MSSYPAALIIAGFTPKIAARELCERR